MDTITFRLIKDTDYTKVKVAFNEQDTKMCFSPEALQDLRSLHDIDVTEELANLIHYEISVFNSTLSESEIKEQVVTEMKRLGL